MREVTTPDVEKPGGNRASQNNQICTTYTMKDTCTTRTPSTILTQDDQAAIAGAREAIRRGLVAVTTPKGRDAALALVDESLAASERPTYDDLEFIRDLADFFGAGRFAESKYRRGRLAGLAICLYSIGSDDAHLEIYGPLCAEHLDLEPVGWHDQNLPPLGWRDDRSDVLHRATLAQIVDLIAEARERGLLEVAA